MKCFRSTTYIIATAINALAAIASAAEISEIRCAFRADSFQGGKSNDISCALSPEEVFSAGDRRHDANDPCSIKSNRFQENLENYVVDLVEKTVKYDEVFLVADFAKASYIQQSMSKGKSREEATADADFTTKRDVSFAIDSVNHTNRMIFTSVTGKPYRPPKTLPTYIIRYGEKTLHYTQGVAQASLVEATGDERHSWINIRFGLCESE